MGPFSNQFDVKLQIGIAVFILLAAPIFGYFYNRAISKMNENEHTSLYVVIGVFFTIMFGALISWKSALMMLILFGLTGVPMIAGEYKRSAKKQKAPRRKKLPYAANGIIDDILMSAKEMQRNLNDHLKSGDPKKINEMQSEVTNVLMNVYELKSIQDK